MVRVVVLVFFLILKKMLLGFFFRSLSMMLARVSPGGSAVKNLPAMQEAWVQSLGQEDPLEKVMATHSSILA